jgi:hypothetical protein
MPTDAAIIIIDYLDRVGRALRADLITWVDHPSYHSKAELLGSAQRLMGASQMAYITGVIDGHRHLPVQALATQLQLPGQDRAYRQQCADLALAAFPIQPTQ